MYKATRNFLPALSVILIISAFQIAGAQDITDLNSGWKCKNIKEVNEKGEEISRPVYSIKNWMDAVVPGTVLTTLLENKKIPDPNVGMNNEEIPDIYSAGNDYYTYWFAKDINIEYPASGRQIWLHLRGVNYSCNVFLNGHPLNKSIFKGMFLRQVYNITPYLSDDGINRIAVIVYPPDPPGNPNGGQGGDGVIARNVTNQYAAGWDWIQPVRDRNTGIWDKIYLEKTGPVNIKNTHVITEVPGVRMPGDPKQGPAQIKVSTELENASDRNISGTLSYTIAGKNVSLKIVVPSRTNLEVHLPELSLEHPKLWWPNGYGPQNLYDLKLQYLENGSVVSDSETIKLGIREITSNWNPATQSRQFEVNGQKIFIKGGNWIVSDAMLRFSKERYDAEVRFHRDANLNLIRIWGGAITERPEFYDACDKYGILVWQEFWMSGDCNGRWQDSRKKDDQWERRKYPDDHALFIQSAVDMVKMLRNHPSLAIWCGGNEITPPNDINKKLNDTLASELDGTRLYIESSTTGDLYTNFKGSTGDGPYGIQPVDVFWKDRSYPFNPELGSVGTGDYESLKRFIPDSSMIVPGKYKSGNKNENLPRWWAGVDPVWRYHKYLGYDDFIDKYGGAENATDFAKIAQLINYNQYRALAEGFTSHMWNWYTGFIIWKTQNPWTALRGQLFDWYLDPNACLYGLHNGSEPLHIMYDPVSYMIMVANNTFSYHNNLMAIAKAYDRDGKVIPLYQQWVDITPSTVKNIQSLERIKTMSAKNGLILSLKLMNTKTEMASENLYWLPDSTGNYPVLEHMPEANMNISAMKINDRKIEVRISNDQTNPMAFFIRLSLVNSETGERILPVFYSDNYISVEPGENKTVDIESDYATLPDNTEVDVEGWNVKDSKIKIKY